MAFFVFYFKYTTAMWYVVLLDERLFLLTFHTVSRRFFLMNCILIKIDINALDALLAITLGLVKLLPPIIKQAKRRERENTGKPKRWKRCFELNVKPGFIKMRNRSTKCLLRWEQNERSNTAKEKESHHSPEKTCLCFSFSIDKLD